LDIGTKFGFISLYVWNLWMHMPKSVFLCIWLQNQKVFSSLSKLHSSSDLKWIVYYCSWEVRMAMNKTDFANFYILFHSFPPSVGLILVITLTIYIGYICVCVCVCVCVCACACTCACVCVKYWSLLVNLQWYFTVRS